MDKKMLELYSDFLIASSGLTTATALSAMTDNAISHDKITRFLSHELLSQEEYWKLIKPIVREIEDENGVICIDDTIEHKPYTDENDIVCYHFDHTTGKSVKGINLLTLFYSGALALPLRYEIIAKDDFYLDDKSGKQKRRSHKTKNEYFQEMLHAITFSNHIKYQTILGDSWFSSSDTMKQIHHKLHKRFIFAMKSNRLVSFSKEAKQRGEFTQISSLDTGIDCMMGVWMKGIDFPLLLLIQHFKNEDGTVGILYLVSNDISLDLTTMSSLYQKRWKIEEYHKSIKQNTGLEKSPTKTVTTQSNHIFASVYAYVKLEMLKFKTSLNHFALKSKIYIKALKAAMSELMVMRQRVGLVVDCA
jgi:DDE superfamily endonuclease